MTDVPVSPEVLKWAREFRGLDEREAATLLKIEVADLRAYEIGEKQPNLTLFERCAAQYRLPTATLFRVTPPDEPRPPEDFRTLKGDHPRDSFEFRVAVSGVRTLLHQIGRLARDDEEFEPSDLPNYSHSVDPEKIAAEERERLGVTVDDQFRWRASEGFRRWRAIIERQGISVFLQKFPLEDCRGFTLFDDAFTPAIVVNKSEWAETARTFTLAHEYCHLLIRRPGISDQNPRSPVEAYCNRFAAAFLMPVDALRRLLPYWPNHPVDWDKDDIEAWALRLKVSQRALALRLEQLGIAPEGFFKRFSWPTRKRRQSGKPGGSYINIRLNEIGGRYASTVMDALDRRVIGRAEAVEALGMSADHFGVVREAVARQRSFAGVE